MEFLLDGINWAAVILGTVAAFAFGWLWYGEKLFGPKWREGIGTPAVATRPMWLSMGTQLISTFLLAWVVAVTQVMGKMSLTILIAITVAGLIKAQGFFGGKTNFAISVDVGYLLLSVVIMLLAYLIV